MKSILILTVVIAILGAYEMIRKAVDTKQEASKNRLAKRRDEFDLKMALKSQLFNDYKAHIESLPDETDVREFEDDVDIKELKPVTLSYESGINNLILSTHHTYRPYETNTLDIHDTLREFTVGDVLGMFY